MPDSPAHEGRPAPTYPIADAVTTQARTVVPDGEPSEKPFPYEVSRYDELGLGRWVYGPGIPVETRDDLAPSGRRSVVGRLLSFFTMTDVHITDEETPIQAVVFGYRGGASSAYSPVMMYTTQVLDAAVQTINALHADEPFDFGICLGDAANNTQLNELRWFIDVLDGHPIDPTSGDHPDGEQRPDYQVPFQPAGLDPEIPWYQSMGNHDHLWIGTLPVTDYLRSFYEGTAILDLGDIFTDPRGVDSRGFYTGALDGRTPLGDVVGAGPVSAFPEHPQVPSADPRRRSLRSREWMREFFTTTSQPVGHGFSQQNIDDDEACYSFQPRADVPLTVLVLDDTQRGTEPDRGGFGHGYLDQARLDWLVGELDRTRDAGDAVVICCHVPIGVEKPGSYIGWSSDAIVSEDELVATLHRYPHLLAWVAGHRHVNAVTPFPSPDPTRPELGFWQVETSSLRDFPQQVRRISIEVNDDSTVSVVAVDIDPAVCEGTPAHRSRGYAVAAQQIFDNPIGLLPSGSTNVELVTPVPPRVADRLRACLAVTR
ncbi:MAG: TIGR03768 family metallophosphoesterase [Candidatus Nanopelagicales bacterium]